MKFLYCSTDHLNLLRDVKEILPRNTYEKCNA